MFVEPLALSSKVFFMMCTQEGRTLLRSIHQQHLHTLDCCAAGEQECKGGLFLQGDPFYAMDLGSNHSDFAEHIFNALANKCGKREKY